MNFWPIGFVAVMAIPLQFQLHTAEASTRRPVIVTCEHTQHENAVKYVKAKNDDSCESKDDCVYFYLDQAIHSNKKKVLKNYSCISAVAKQSGKSCPPTNTVDSQFSMSGPYKEPPVPSDYDCKANKCSPIFGNKKADWSIEAEKVRKEAESKFPCREDIKNILNQPLPSRRGR